MLTFMDYIVREFGTATGWNYDNSYSFLTATSDALLAFDCPSSISLHVSSLSTANFATSYTLSTLGQLDGAISYLYSNIALSNVASQSINVPLKRITLGYRDVPLPVSLEDTPRSKNGLQNGRKPTLLHATLALPPPSTLTGLYARRIDQETLLSLFVNSKTVIIPSTTGPPPATILAHIQRDTGRYSLEGIGSTDSGLLGVRGLWNFGLGQSEPAQDEVQALKSLGGSPDIPIDSISVDRLSPYLSRLSQKPSLLSAGAEFYYSPLSHVIGLSTGLRFTTLASHIVPNDRYDTEKKSSKPFAGTSAAFTSSLLAPSNVSQSSFPYTMTLTLNPLIGSLASTYSVKPTSNLALSSRFDFNVYSWESQYVFGAEIWRKRHRRPSKTKIDAEGNTIDSDPSAWVKHRTSDWFTPEELALKEERRDREEENVLKFRIDDGWNVKALWTGRLKKSLLVSAGVTVSPVGTNSSGMRFGRSSFTFPEDNVRVKRLTATVGLSIAYST